MFGYIKPFVPELKVRENELYKAVYCGLCKSMGKTTKAFSKLTLSYDAVFLALVRASLSGERFEIKKGRCLLHPFKKKSIAEDCEILRYCAAVSAELSYRNLLDKINDSHGIKKLFYRLLLPKFRKIKKRAEKVAAFDDTFITSALNELSELEAKKEPSPRRRPVRTPAVPGEKEAAKKSEEPPVTDIFGMPDGVKQSAAVIGRNTGRFIYMCDAADDIYEDEKSGCYNPILLSEGETEEKLHRAAAAMCVWADTAAGELLLEGEPSPETDIALNILKLGMPDAAQKTTGKEGKKKHGKRSV